MILQFRRFILSSLGLLFVFVAQPLWTALHGALAKLPSRTQSLTTASAPMGDVDSKRSLARSQAYGELPIYFEPNLGQTNSQVKFIARGSGVTTFLTATEAAFSLPIGDFGLPNGKQSIKRVGDPAGLDQRPVDLSPWNFAFWRTELSLGPTSQNPLHSPRSAIANRQSAISMKLVGANPNAQIEGLDLLPGISNYFIGNDSSNWRTNVPHYARVRYRDVYPGIDLVYHHDKEQLEYDLIVAPGADPALAEISFGWAEHIEVDGAGSLLVSAPGMRLRQRVPFAYQLAGGEKRRINCRYRLKGKQAVGFEQGEYDLARALVIDPTIDYQVILPSGGSPYAVQGIAVDPAGNAYLSGETSSLNFPTTPGAFQTSFGGYQTDGFVTKLNAAGTAVVYTTYLGGDSVDTPSSLAVDSSGNAYVTGHTWSASFPVTPGAFSRFHSIGANTDSFVSKLSPSGANLVYSTYLGGNSFDSSGGIVVDALGRAFVGGSTSSSDFPATPLAFQRSVRGESDAFVTQLNPGGTGLVYSTLLGGANNDGASGIALDLAGSAYVTGVTTSTDFPVTPGALQTTYGGDGFVAKFSAAGSVLAYSTFLPGWGYGLAVDKQGNTYVAASTPVPQVTKINPSGTSAVFSTTLAGGDRIAVSRSGTIYTLAEATNLQRMETSVLTALSASGDNVLSTQLFGGSDPWIHITRFALGEDDSLYIAGRSETDASHSCTSPGFHLAYFGTSAGYVRKISASDATTLFVPIVLSAAGLNGSFFTSELTFTNKGTANARLDFEYSAAFGGGSGTASDTLPRGQQRILPDAISYLRSRGVPIPSSGNVGGTLRIRFSGLSSPEDAATSARTTTTVAGGRAGLAYSSIPVSSGLTGTVYLAGLRQNSTDRSNLAIQNLGVESDGDLLLRLTVFSGDASAPAEQVLPEERLSPGGFRQINGILASNGLSLTEGYVRVERVSGSASYYAYAVINDQMTSDGSFIPPISQLDSDETPSLMIPAVVRSGAFSSEVILANWRPETKRLKLRFVSEEFYTIEASIDVELAPRQQLVIPDIIQFLRERGAAGLDPAASYAGSLFVEKQTPPCCFRCVDTRSLFVGARTSARGGGGNFGVFYPAVPVRAASANSVWIFGLRQDAENRTNLAFAQTGYSVNSERNPVTLRVDLFDGDTGQLVRTVEGVTLRFSEWKQINSVLANFAPGVRNGYARITRSAGKDPFYAYAVINDGATPGERTGDGAFIASAP